MSPSNSSTHHYPLKRELCSPCDLPLFRTNKKHQYIIDHSINHLVTLHVSHMPSCYDFRPNTTNSEKRFQPPLGTTIRSLKEEMLKTLLCIGDLLDPFRREVKDWKNSHQPLWRGQTIGAITEESKACRTGMR